MPAVRAAPTRSPGSPLLEHLAGSSISTLARSGRQLPSSITTPECSRRVISSSRSRTLWSTESRRRMRNAGQAGRAAGNLHGCAHGGSSSTTSGDGFHAIAVTTSRTTSTPPLSDQRLWAPDRLPLAPTCPNRVQRGCAGHRTARAALPGRTPRRHWPERHGQRWGVAHLRSAASRADRSARRPGVEVSPQATARSGPARRCGRPAALSDRPAPLGRGRSIAADPGWRGRRRVPGAVRRTHPGGRRSGAWRRRW